MSESAAKNRLNRNLLYEMARSIVPLKCYKCNQPIHSPQDLAIEHLSDWRQFPQKYWDLDDLIFTHVDCNRRSKYISPIL